jgi:hypothetical protein
MEVVGRVEERRHLHLLLFTFFSSSPPFAAASFFIHSSFSRALFVDRQQSVSIIIQHRIIHHAIENI